MSAVLSCPPPASGWLLQSWIKLLPLSQPDNQSDYKNYRQLKTKMVPTISTLRVVGVSYFPVSDLVEAVSDADL